MTFTGFEPFWGHFLADGLNQSHGDALECSWLVWPSSWPQRLAFVAAVRQSDVVVRLGMPFEFTSETNFLWLQWMVRSARKTGVNYWIGSDVRVYLERRAAGLTTDRDHEAARRLIHFAGAQNLTDALVESGVAALTVVVPSPEREAPIPPPPLPNRFEVLSYWSDANFVTNGGEFVIEAARQLPDVAFEVMGTDGRNVHNPPENVRFLGKVDDVAQCYERATVVVRIPIWDSVPSGVVEEALLFGRHVIYSYEFPHTITVPHGDREGLVSAITRLHDASGAGTLTVNDAGAAFMREYGAPAPRWDRMASALISAHSRASSA